MGRRTVALLREAGWSVRHLGEVYADDGQHVPDEEWIACGLANGWALLTQDERIRYRAHERGALADGGNPLFYLSKKDLLIADKVHRFHSQQVAIYRAVARGEAAIYAVYEDRIEKKWP
ncbi:MULTISPECIES: toxin-antitoxin system, toxin component, PIN family protein [Streptomyces]|uniref:Toxin-antitoxin system, toxin component, PIN family protein n=2 Tax=Streptomyces TaxID=1883 RepID=A0ABU2XDL9_9ACTN|nr:toxin-antitoxin system, toxin component, PIN family protein [Streptomyces sp. DSM 41529]MDT0544008.1 toxin-antitoxin system, toxin component, PIN family protein [Streptomyces sp. DSM 41529]